MRRFRPRLTYANVVSTLCLFILLGGGAYAATKLPKNSVGPKQLKKNAVTTKAIKDAAVTSSKLADGAVTGGKVAAHSLRAEDLAPGVIPAPSSVTPPGGTLPAGTTLRGAAGAESACSTAGCSLGAGSGISFGGYTLPSRPLANVVPAGGPSTPACPGTVTDPEASAGNLCFYIGFSLPEEGTVLVLDPTVNGLLSNGATLSLKTKAAGTRGDGRVSPVGFQLEFEPSTFNTTMIRGTWAVTP